MTTMTYYPRIYDKLLKALLESSGAVLIEGPKWCGKTSTAREASKSILYMQDPDRGPGYALLADTMPSQLLKGDKPRVIDEWQEAPVLWDAVRFDVDQTNQRGQYILTGSAVPREDQKPKHTGTGRISRLKMSPMSLFESKESTGSVSLNDLFNGKTDVFGENPLTILDIAEVICRGGWPNAVVSKDKTTQTARNYVEAVINIDVQRVDGVDRNPHRVRALLRSYARNISTLAATSTIMADIQANDTSISENTVYSYINALERIFLIDDIPAWKPSLRSRSAIRTSSKRQFVDPSIATAVMKMEPESILMDFEYFGFLFESLVTRDLRVYAQSLEGDIFHYRDKDNLEADLIIRLHDGRWAAVEVKLGSKSIEEGAKHLCALREKVDTSRVGEPAFLMIVTGGEFAYRRKDGVFVVPIGCLKD